MLSYLLSFVQADLTKRDPHELAACGFSILNLETAVRLACEGIAELLTALQTIYPSAKYLPAYPWVYAMLRSPASDWSKPDVLWRMHKNPEFVTDLANQLLEIALERPEFVRARFL